MTNDKTDTTPVLRERLKEETKAGGKGGKSGEWPARKSQRLVPQYEHAGGGDTRETRTPHQEPLEEWTEQE